MRIKSLLIAVSVLALAVPTAAQAAPTSGAQRVNPVRAKVDASVLPKSIADDTRVNVILEMEGDPVAVVEAKAERVLSDSERTSIRSGLKSKQDAARAAISAKGGKVTGQMQSAYNGVQVSVTRKNVEALASVAGVVAVHAIAQHTPDNAVSVPYLGVPGVWQSTGYTGTGVKIGIIDTGIDYTHADFGGPGTTAAYEAAKASGTATADPALFGPSAPRVKGGYDLAGDGYDASGKKGSTTPTPDVNPLDCSDAGHGTHVAGTAAGGGVNADGTAYAGPYNAATSERSWSVGPGVAPQADIYAYRVFGCFGSTDLTTLAIDRAVQDGVNVINMSLGSPFGLPDDPSAVAASNAVGAGVVVIASAGNSGGNPYLVGSPSTGAGVISVAAQDSTKEFPGALITLAGGTPMQAINANGASPLPAGPFTIVVLADDPATGENEALGCSVAAYTKAGVVAGGGQIAVSKRGTCARVAKAVNAQKAGAAAALMLNTTDVYPPYEGAIASDPDTGEAYPVTIPFIGVKSSQAAAIIAAAGKTLTLAANRLANPAYTALADFSSGGPRSYDSGLRPSVTAPGVSIMSALVGSGSGSEILSGTSMAAPQTAGAAALTVQAHRSWSSQDIAAALVSTADAGKIAGYRLTLGGQGQIDVAQSVATTSVLLGDQFTTSTGVRLREPSVSFGFAELSSKYSATKNVVIKNNGTTPVTYKMSSAATPQSVAASVMVTPQTVRVAPGRSEIVRVKLSVDPAKLSTSEGPGFQFAEVSGSVVATASDGSTLAVPYLLVPRAEAKAAVSLGGRPQDRDGLTATFTNKGGALPAGLDFYTLGLLDGRDLPANSLSAGMDLRAAGVQAFPADDLLVFAINNWTRYSNAAVHEFDVQVDTNLDGTPDYVVFAADYGLVTTGDPNGKMATFVYTMSDGSLYATAFTTAPTDSSTVLLSVGLSDLGLTSAHGTFKYTVMSYSGEDTATVDKMAGWATYNPFAKALLSDGTYATVERNKSLSMKLPVDPTAMAATKPLGLMVVAYDNAAGASEALLVPVR